MATNEGQARESSLTTEGVVQPERFMNPAKLIDELEKTGFSFNDPKDPEYICELYEDFTEPGILIFNHNGDFIAECEDEEDDEDSDDEDLRHSMWKKAIENIYTWIRFQGWSLIEHPIDVSAWILYPSVFLTNPITSIYGGYPGGLSADARLIQPEHEVWLAHMQQ